MSQGRVKLHRKILDSFAGSNLELLGLVDYMLLMANHEGNTFYIGTTKHTVKPGQFVSSMQKIADRFYIGKSKVYRLVKVLEEEGFLKRKGNAKSTVFTIIKREEYQGVKRKGNDSDTTSETQTDTNKNDKNEEEGKEISFDEFWNMYPNKKGKAKAQKLFKSKIKTSSSFEQLMLGLEGYINRKPNEQGFKPSDQQGDTFLSKETRKDYLQEVPIDIETAEKLAILQEDLQVYKNYLIKSFGDKRIELHGTDYSRVKKIINEKSLIPIDGHE